MALPEGRAWLVEAQGGSREALGEVLEACRGYLLLIAHQELDTDLQAKGGVSDLVQETLYDAVGAFDQFHGGTSEELRGWLRRMLLNNLVSFTRRYRDADKRAASRETAIQPDSSGGGLAAPTETPSRQAVAHEEAEAVRRGLERLPEDYRRVLHLRYQENRTFEEIGRMLGLTANGARKLWGRAVKRLQQESGGTP